MTKLLQSILEGRLSRTPRVPEGKMASKFQALVIALNTGDDGEALLKARGLLSLMRSRESLFGLLIPEHQERLQQILNAAAAAGQ